jgi:hypothetical protein
MSFDLRPDIARVVSYRRRVTLEASHLTAIYSSFREIPGSNIRKALLWVRSSTGRAFGS